MIAMNRMTKLVGFGAATAIASYLVVISGPAKPVLLPSAPTADWFVAPDGDNSNACNTPEAPCATVDGAENKAIAAGDIIEVAPGTYAGQITLTKNGTEGNKIVYRGHSGACPTTPNSDVYAPATRPNPTAVTDTWVVQAAYVVIDCFKIQPQTPASNGISLITGVADSNNDFINNYINGNEVNVGVGIAISFNGAPSAMSTGNRAANNYITRTSFGINLRTTFATIEDNEIYSLRGYTGSGDVDYMRVFGEDLTLRRNYFHGTSVAECGGIECHVDGFQNFNVAGAAYEVSRRVTIEGNTVFNVHQGILMQDVYGPFHTDNPSGSHDTIRVVNNVFAKNLTGSTMVWCMLFNAVTNITSYHNTCLAGQSGYREKSTFVHRNNLHYVNTQAPAWAESGSVGTITDNLFYNPNFTYDPLDFPGNIVNQDPLFVSATPPDVVNDITLQSGSPARAAGAALDVLVDRMGRLRQATPDIGAHERRP